LIIEQSSVGFAEAQRVSKALFGNQDRLMVAAAIAEAEPGSVFGRSLATQLGISDHRVGLQLKALESAGLLVRMPKVGGEQRVYFERVSSGFWDLCVKLAAEIADRSRD
jgi:DNA-binding MarR family transcriptional regulator